MSAHPRRWSPDVAAVLLAAIRDEGGEQRRATSNSRPTRGADFHGLAAAAAFHGITGYVHRMVHDAAWIPEDERAALSAGHDAAIVRHLLTVADLRVAAAILDAAGVEWLVFKGPVLAEHYHERVDLRGYRDLDLLVAGGQLRTAVAAFEASGHGILDQNWSLLRRERRGEVHLVLGRGTVADLHWDLVNEGPIRDAFAIPHDEVLYRRRLVAVDDFTVPTLDPVATLVHLGVHATLSGGHRLVWSKDVERVLRVDTPDWDDVVRRAREWRVGFPLAGALRTAHRATGAPVPSAVLRDLCPSRTWGGIAGAVGRWSPPARATGRGSLQRIVARSTRQDLPASLGQLARRSASWLQSLATPASRRTPPGRVDPASPGSLYFPCGGDEERETYLDTVARHAR